MADGFTACKTCHGTYTRKSSQSDLSQPGSWTVAYKFSHVLRDVKTDPVYNATLQKLRPIAEHINKLEAYFTARRTPELTPACHRSGERRVYVALPLDGVWASAPYFHNGSVPTLDTVLNSQQRPKIWSRDNRDPHAYDLVRVGLKYAAVSPADFAAKCRRRGGQNRSFRGPRSTTGQSTTPAATVMRIPDILSVIG